MRDNKMFLVISPKYIPEMNFSNAWNLGLIDSRSSLLSNEVVGRVDRWITQVRKLDTGRRIIKYRVVEPAPFGIHDHLPAFSGDGRVTSEFLDF
jgi:hypothetical protein